MSGTTLVIFIAVMAVMALLSALWSAAETALFSLSHSDRVRLRKLSPEAASQATYLLNRPRPLLIALLTANTIVASAYYVIASIFATDVPAWAAAVISVASLVFMTLCAEVLPKTLASLNRVQFARAVLPIVTAWYRVSWPLCRFTDRFALTPLTRLVLPPREVEPITVEELGELLEAQGGEGGLDVREQRLLAEVLELGTLRVRDVMTPRVDVAWIDERATAATIADIVRRTGHRKFPMFRGGPEGQILGMLDAQTYFAAQYARTKGEPQPALLLEPVRFVPERARLDQLLEHFRATRSHLAICVDEHGAITGLVEVEDAVKELVRTRPQGAGGEGDVRRVAEGVWHVPGRLGLRHWREFFGEALGGQSRRVATVGGLVMAQIGRVPRAGDTVRIGGIEMRVLHTDGAFVEVVEVRLVDAEANPEVAPGRRGRSGVA